MTEVAKAASGRPSFCAEICAKILSRILASFEMVRGTSFPEPAIGNICMRISGLCIVVAFAFAAAMAPAGAQPKKDAKSPGGSGPEVRYFTSLNGLMGDQAD